MKRGLVLEGGAMRGMFTAGVTDVMMENGIEFDGMIGVSAGAAFGCNYKSNQPGRVIRYNIKYCKEPKYCSFRSLIKTGNIYGADFCYHELAETLDPFDFDTFKNSPMEFHIVCTDVETGEPVYHQCKTADYDELEWVRASASMPLVSKIVEAGGKKMLDGGVSDSIPLEYFQSIGYDKNIVVLTQPKDYTKGKNSTMPLAKIMLRKYPKLLDKMAHRHELYNKSRDYIFADAKGGNTLVICPDEKLPIGHIEHDADVLKKVYDIGREVATRRLDEIKEFLKAN